MRELLSESKKFELIRCPKCGTVVGGIGDICDCSVPCPKCELFIDVVANSEELIVRKKRRKGLKPVPQN